MTPATPPHANTTHPDDCVLTSAGHHLAVHRSLHTSLTRPEAAPTPTLVNCEVTVSTDGSITVTFGEESRTLWHHGHHRLTKFLDTYSPDLHGPIGFDPDTNRISLFTSGSVEHQFEALLPHLKRWDYRSTILLTCSLEPIGACADQTED